MRRYVIMFAALGLLIATTGNADAHMGGVPDTRQFFPDPAAVAGSPTEPKLAGAQETSAISGGSDIPAAGGAPKASAEESTIHGMIDKVVSFFENLFKSGS